MVPQPVVFFAPTGYDTHLCSVLERGCPNFSKSESTEIGCSNLSKSESTEIGCSKFSEFSKFSKSKSPEIAKGPGPPPMEPPSGRCLYLSVSYSAFYLKLSLSAPPSFLLKQLAIRSLWPGIFPPRHGRDSLRHVGLLSGTFSPARTPSLRHVLSGTYAFRLLLLVPQIILISKIHPIMINNTTIQHVISVWQHHFTHKCCNLSKCFLP